MTYTVSSGTLNPTIPYHLEAGGADRESLVGESGVHRAVTLVASARPIISFARRRAANELAGRTARDCVTVQLVDLLHCSAPVLRPAGANACEDQTSRPRKQ